MATEISTADVARELGVSQRRVRALIQAGRLPARRVGPVWLVEPADLERVRIRRPGRPRSRTDHA